MQNVLITGIFVSRIDGLVKRFLSSTFEIHFEVETAGNCLVPQGDLDDLFATASNVGISFFPQRSFELFSNVLTQF